MVTLTNTPDAQQKIFEVQSFCSAKYFCRQQLIAKYYAWDGDSIPNGCGKCDNCVSCIADDAHQLQNAVDDVCEMMEVVRCLTAQHQNVTQQDLVDVFTHAKTRDMETKGYMTSEAYKRTYIRKVLVSKDLAHHALNDLIASGFIKQVCELKRQKECHMTCNAYIIGVKENAENSIRNKSWVYLAPRRQRRTKRI
jgi:hypothetical protein